MCARAQIIYFIYNIYLRDKRYADATDVIISE